MAKITSNPETRAQAWHALTTAHNLIENALEKAISQKHGLSLVEYVVLETLEKQAGWHIRMQQLVKFTKLSKSATTRLINRLEKRGLTFRYICAEDRRGIYSELSDAGKTLIKQVKPTYDEALEKALEEASKIKEIAPLIQVCVKQNLREGR